MKTIYKFIIALSVLFFYNTSMATECSIHLMAITAEQDEEIPSDVNNLLIQKLISAITTDGVSASPDYDRFFVSGKITHLHKDVVPGPPMSHVIHSTLTLYIGDVITKKVYASTSFELRGVGTSESRAFINAFRLLNHNNKKISDFTKQGSQKILAYYNAEYPLLIKQAKQAAATNNYEKALNIVTSIPECCVGYNEAATVTISIYNKYINQIGRVLLSKARAEWGASPDKVGAKNAYEYLILIDPDADCYNEATALSNEIKKVVKENWDFEEKTKYTDSVETDRLKIEAARAIGVAFGNGQKETTTNLMWLK